MSENKFLWINLTNPEIWKLLFGNFIHLSLPFLPIFSKAHVAIERFFHTVAMNEMPIEMIFSIEKPTTTFAKYYVHTWKEIRWQTPYFIGDKIVHLPPCAAAWCIAIVRALANDNKHDEHWNLHVYLIKYKI